MDMTKFGSFEDPGFIAVCGELRRWLKELRVVGGIEITAPAEASAQQTDQEGGARCT
jgi:hypothetical protein